jgi:hypothetical protein
MKWTYDFGALDQHWSVTHRIKWECFWGEHWDAPRLLAEAIEIWLLTVDATVLQ